MIDEKRIDHSSIKATIESVVMQALQLHGLTLDELRTGEIRPETVKCMQEILRASSIIDAGMIAAYTNITQSRISAINWHHNYSHYV